MALAEIVAAAALTISPVDHAVQWEKELFTYGHLTLNRQKVDEVPGPDIVTGNWCRVDGGSDNPDCGYQTRDACRVVLRDAVAPGYCERR